jgi:hypothetical protein
MDGAHTPYAGDFSSGSFNNPGTDHWPFATDAGYLDISAWNYTDYGVKKSSGWSSGLMASVDHNANGFSAPMGYWEAKIWLPTPIPGTNRPVNDPNGIAGLWPGFWLDAVNTISSSTNTGAEVDIMEAYSVDNFMGYWTRWHTWQGGQQIAANGANIPAPGGVSLDAGWHIYSCLINPDRTHFYLDGKEVWSDVTQDSMKVPLYCFVNLAMIWPIDVSPGTLNPGGASSQVYHMLCQYVRCWALPQ